MIEVLDALDNMQLKFNRASYHGSSFFAMCSSPGQTLAGIYMLS